MGEGKYKQAKKKKRKLTSACRFKPIEPKIFWIGDIVEMQVSFITMPLQGGKQKLRAVLRSIALLDGKCSQVSDL